MSETFRPWNPEETLLLPPSPVDWLPESHILNGGDGWIQGYNCQAAVNGDHQVIVTIDVSNRASYAVHLLPTLGRIQANTGQQPEAFIADAGYCSTANLEACEHRDLARCSMHCAR